MVTVGFWMSESVFEMDLEVVNALEVVHSYRSLTNETNLSTKNFVLLSVLAYRPACFP